MPAKYIPKNSDYHIRQVRICPYCAKPRRRYVTNLGRNKGFQRTCGSTICRLAAARRPDVIAKKSHKGSQHPKWVEDRSLLKKRPQYEQKWWRVAIFDRDNYICQFCGQRGGKLQAHHIKSYAKYPELRWNLDNGMTLCLGCHKTTPGYAGRK